MKGALHCESEYNRGAGCGKTARPDLYGGLYENEVPTISIVYSIKSILGLKTSAFVSITFLVYPALQ